MSNDILLSFSRLWGSKKYVEDFIDIRFIFRLLKRAYINISFKICELFWDVNIDNDIYEKYKNNKHKTDTYFTPQL